ncbi:hypothetical protein [Brumimicrobium oceani]|uniref:hypothetical protein n=1 Tax=Brumimicrobium oceani TaxID=2100725 RepID=UPI0018EE6BCE|nr:hypothetical protein [Brumimicrobium oceani]
MHKITEVEIDFILKDIKANGVVIEDLQYNLLDHICCIIENEKSDNEDFYEFYKKIMPRFFKKDLKEIQEETEILLKFKNYYAMKNTLKVTGLATAILTVLGALLKTFHLPGAGVAIVLGGGLFSLIFLPLLIILKFKDEESRKDKWVFSVGFLLAMQITIGIIFKLMHWPGANIIMISGVVAFTFIYVPLYFFTRFKRPELQLNTIVNSVLMLACGGMLFSLQNLGYSSKSKMAEDKIHEYVELNKANIENANLELYFELDTNRMEISTLRSHTNLIINLVDQIKSNWENHINSDSTSDALVAKLIEYNEFITKYATVEKRIDADFLFQAKPSDKVYFDMLNMIQLQVINNENALLNRWS